MKTAAKYKVISRYTPSEKREGNVQSTLSLNCFRLFPQEHKSCNGSLTINKSALFLFQNTNEDPAGISATRRCGQGLLHESRSPRSNRNERSGHQPITSIFNLYAPSFWYGVPTHNGSWRNNEIMKTYILRNTYATIVALVVAMFPLPCRRE